MKTHALKIQQEYLEEIKAGNKTSEIRLNDRDYQRSDVLEFTDYSALENPKQLRYLITHIHSGLGLEKNYVVLSIRPTQY